MKKSEIMINRLRFFVIAKPTIREDIMLSVLSQSEQNYCLEMTNQNARMRRILGRLSIAYASKQLLGATKTVQSGKYGKPLVDGISFSITHRNESNSGKSVPQFQIGFKYFRTIFEVVL